MTMEIIRGPVTAYVADPNTAHPAILSATPDAAPASPYVLLGASISDDGLQMEYDNEEEETTTLDSPMVKKFNIVKVGVTYSLSLVDMSVETFARVQNGVAVSEQAIASTNAGYREMVIGHGFTVKYYAVVFKGLSPYADGGAGAHQVYLPKAHIRIEEGPTLAKSGDAMIGVSVRPVFDSTIGGLGVYRASDPTIT